jgi:putative transposase
MADHHDELYWRRQAIRLRLKGWRPCEILTRLPRKREWLRKWWLRFTTLGWKGLHERSRRPVHAPQAYTQQAHTVVLSVRRALEQRQVGLVGARAVQQEILDHHLLQQVPSLATIKRWLHTAGVIQPVVEESPERYYPEPARPAQAVWQACDWIARYLKGGAKVFVFHTVDLETRALGQTICSDKTVASVRAHLLSTWQTLGLPHRLHLDNDAAFTGGERTKRRLGTVVRLCLYLGIEVVFLPVGEPKRNAVVERINGLWAQQFWERNHFRKIGEVVQQQDVFLDWYAQTYRPPSLEGLTPAQAQRRVRHVRLSKRQARSLPARLPITAGRVHFVRRVAADGTISFLGERWSVSRRLAHEYIWATVITHCRRLELFHRRSARAKWQRIKACEYALPETVCRLRPEFKR